MVDLCRTKSIWSISINQIGSLEKRRKAITVRTYTILLASPNFTTLEGVGRTDVKSRLRRDEEHPQAVVDKALIVMIFGCGGERVSGSILRRPELCLEFQE